MTLRNSILVTKKIRNMISSIYTGLKSKVLEILELTQQIFEKVQTRFSCFLGPLYLKQLSNTNKISKPPR